MLAPGLADLLLRNLPIAFLSGLGGGWGEHALIGPDFCPLSDGAICQSDGSIHLE